MTPLALAEAYMETIFSGADVDRLAELLTEDFTFSGPLYQFGSRDEYIGAMRQDPLADAGYTITDRFENENAACLIYTFNKPGTETPMAQAFTVRDGKICKVLLLFDARAFV